ncbi:MAG: amidohydrolase family protein, partial [Bacilli bacterium]
SKRFIPIHNPCSNLKLKSGIFNMDLFLNNNFKVTLGSDGSASNNSLDLLNDAKTSILVMNYFSNNNISALEYYKMMSINAAQALGFNNLGMIKEGYLADLITFDLNDLSLNPINDIFENIIYSLGSKSISDVMINGHFTILNKEFMEIDYQNELDLFKQRHQAFLNK